MSLRAVIFDYGKVLSGPQDPKAYNEMLRISGLSRERFEHFYWADRPLYDDGTLTGLAFWQKLAQDAQLSLTPVQIEELNYWDGRVWLTQNPSMIAWQLELKQNNFLTAILSNMGDTVLANIEQDFAWIHRFDLQVWSYQLRMAKPDPAIYQYTLKKLNIQPEEALFLDDKEENIDAARNLGIQAILYSTTSQLHSDLIAAGLDKQLPLPEIEKAYNFMS